MKAQNLKNLVKQVMQEVVGLIVLIFIFLLASLITKNFTEDSELNELKKENLRLEIAIKKMDLKNTAQ